MAICNGWVDPSPEYLPPLSRDYEEANQDAGVKFYLTVADQQVTTKSRERNVTKGNQGYLARYHLNPRLTFIIAHLQ